MNTNTLTPEQEKAVLAFAECHGPTWKSKLRAAWITGRYQGVTSSEASLLQQVRNTLGPKWLDSYCTPKERAIYEREDAVLRGAYRGLK